VSFDAAHVTIGQLQLILGSGAESLSCSQLAPHKVATTDRGYAYRAVLFHIFFTGLNFLVYINWPNIPLLHPDAIRLDVISLLRSPPEVHEARFYCNWIHCRPRTRPREERYSIHLTFAPPTPVSCSSKPNFAGTGCLPFAVGSDKPGRSGRPDTMQAST
jgi:hypothetical protein